MNSQYNISVIIPTYNSSEFVLQSVESAINQTLRPFEVIVVDDGSTDGTPNLIKNHFPNVIVLENQNNGAAAARNYGIRYAKGNWVAFLDSDDIWDNKHLENILSILMSEKSLVWCAGAWTMINNLNEKIFFNCYNGKYLRDKIIENIFLAYKDFDNKVRSEIISTCAVVAKKDILVECNGFNEKMKTGEDIDLWFRIATKYPVLGYSQENNFFYRRINSVSLTLSNQNSKVADIQFNRIQISWQSVADASKSNRKIYSIWLNVWLFRLLKRAIKERNYMVLVKTRSFSNYMDARNLLLFHMSKIIIKILRF